MPLGTDRRKPPDEPSNAIPADRRVDDFSLAPCPAGTRTFGHGAPSAPNRQSPKADRERPQPLRSSPRNDARARLGPTWSGRASMVFWPKIRLASGAFPPRCGRSVSLGRYEECATRPRHPGRRASPGSIPAPEESFLADEADRYFCPVCGIGLAKSDFEMPLKHYYCPYCSARQTPLSEVCAVTDPTAISAMDSSQGSRRRFTAPWWQRSLALVVRSGPRPGAREEPVDA
jgi:hypothetical protein